jgi:hypothetical protein
LQDTVKIAPGSDKAVLLVAKAALLSGNFEIGTERFRGTVEDTSRM